MGLVWWLIWWRICPQCVGDPVRSLDREDPWRARLPIPVFLPGRLQSTRLKRVGHVWATKASCPLKIWPLPRTLECVIIIRVCFYLFIFSVFLVSYLSCFLSFSFKVLLVPTPNPFSFCISSSSPQGARAFTQTGRSVSFKELLLSVPQEFLRQEKTKSLISNACLKREGNEKRSKWINITIFLSQVPQRWQGWTQSNRRADSMVSGSQPASQWEWAKEKEGGSLELLQKLSS